MSLLLGGVSTYYCPARGWSLSADPLPHTTILSSLMVLICCLEFSHMLILEDSKKKLSSLLFSLSQIFLCFMQIWEENKTKQKIKTNKQKTIVSEASGLTPEAELKNSTESSSFAPPHAKFSFRLLPSEVIFSITKSTLNVDLVSLYHINHC